MKFPSTLLFAGLCWLLPAMNARATSENYPAVRAWLEKEAASAPFLARGEDNVRYLELAINDKVAVGMVDTGADACWLLKSRLDKVGAPRSMAQVRRFLWSPRVTLGAPPLTAPVGIMLGDFPSLENDNTMGRRPIDLVCGQPFFTSFPGLLDFAGGRYWVYRNPLDAIRLKEMISSSGWHMMELEKVGHYHFFTARVGKQPVRFLADTGTGHTLIQESLAVELGFSIERIGGKMIGLGRENGVLSSCIARDLDFGTVQFPKLPVIVSDEVALLGKSYPGGPPVRGILGAEIMRAAGVLYDPVNAWIAWPENAFDPLAYGEVNPLGGASREKLPAQVRDSTDIVMAKVASVKLSNSGIGNRMRRIASVELRVQNVVKGTYREGDAFTIRVDVSSSVDQGQSLAADYQGRAGRRLVLMKRDEQGIPSLVSWFDFWSDRYMLIKQLVAEPEGK